MLTKLIDVWETKGPEILLCISIVFILGFGLYHIIIGKKGTYSKDRYFLPVQYHNRQPNSYINIQQNHGGKKESKGEAECRRVLQNIFGKPFTSQRPDFLRNPVTGNNFNLELDCYNHDLRLAVEYNGVQHYKYVPFFHRNKDHFMTQKYRDDMKRRICREHNINLIEVPYTVRIENIKDFIIQNCRKIGYRI